MKSALYNDSLCPFWKFAQLLGIDVPMDRGKKRETSLKKNYSLFIVFLMLLSPVIVFYIVTSLAPSLSIYRISHIIQAITIELMYFTILKSKSQLVKVRKLVNLLPPRKKPDICFKFLQFLINLSIFIMLVYPICEYSRGFSSSRAYEVKTITWYVYIIYSYAYILLFLVAPIILTSLFCAVCYQWKEIIAYLKNDLQTQKICFMDLRQLCIARNLFHKCRLLWNATYFIKNTFSAFLFYSLAKSTFVIFLLAVAVRQSTSLDMIAIKIIIFTGVEFFYFISMVYTASKIPDEMDDLLKLLKQIYQDIYFEETSEKRVIILRKQMKWMINEKPVILTAGGWVDIRKSLMLNVFGNLITYGLTIVQNNPRQ